MSYISFFMLKSKKKDGDFVRFVSQGTTTTALNRAERWTTWEGAELTLTRTHSLWRNYRVAEVRLYDRLVWIEMLPPRRREAVEHTWRKKRGDL